MSTRFIVFLIFISLTVGCSYSEPIFRKQLDHAVYESASFQRVLSIYPERAIWYIEGEVESDVVTCIYIGFDEGTHTTRWATLRVRKGGVVEKEVMREDGELVWVADE